MGTENGWEITNTGARTFTAVGSSCSAVLKKLRASLKAAGVKDRDTSGLMLQIGFVGTDGDRRPASESYEGWVTVSL